MFLDLSNAPLVFVPALCPGSVVVRTMRPSNVVDPNISRVLTLRPFRTETLAPAISKAIGSDFILDETLLPLPHGRQAEEVPQNWHATSWPKRGDTALAWKVALLLRQEKPDVYRLTVTEVTENLPLASAVFRIDACSLAMDRLPLLGPVSGGLSDAYQKILDG